ncbi:hypothetical protein [Streptomyces sp. NPDC052496]|uniref:hypothetical protein n=1 Tax=Streptomyces sp. NPDC052496 TaxID=3154951 RepID=UPI00342E5626
MLIQRFFPAPLGPFVGAAADAFLDEALRRAVGAPTPPPGYRPGLPAVVRDLA